MKSKCNCGQILGGTIDGVAIDSDTECYNCLWKAHKAKYYEQIDTTPVPGTEFEKGKAI